MKTREAIQTKDTRETSDASLASRYRDVRRLRDEVREAEIICARQKSKNSKLGAGRPSVSLSDQEFIDFLS
jgi:hypothetical protein